MTLIGIEEHFLTAEYATHGTSPVLTRSIRA